MNFRDMWSVQQHSDALCVFPLFAEVISDSLGCSSFWTVGIPIFIVVIVVALWAEVEKLLRYVQRRDEMKKMLAV